MGGSQFFMLVFAINCVTSIYSVFTEKEENFRFASYYADHMVLQSSPQRAVLWGFGTPRSLVELTINHDIYTTRVQENRTWLFVTGPYNTTDSDEPNTIIAKNYKLENKTDSTEIVLNDILFGEVWICSGQSNMEMGLGYVFNSEEEIRNVLKFNDIRTIQLKQQIGKVPQLDVESYITQWTRPKDESLRKGWGGFSALCMFYGINLHEKLNIPIGLIQSTWGGSQIESWCSPQALANCGERDRSPVSNRDSNSALWNSMVHPLLKMTIKGVIWYQGEENAKKHSRHYDCLFPALINDWRKNWYLRSRQTTEMVYPFGFVQLAGSVLTPLDNWPLLRWQQTTQVGYVPNTKMPATFMAVATDLNDPMSPYQSIHPRDKKTIAARLSWAAFNIVYHMEEYPKRGPHVLKSVTKSDNKMIIQYDQNITHRSNDVFSFNCTHGGWRDALITKISHNEIALLLPLRCSYFQFAYLWKQTPCAYKLCAIYSDNQYQLPSPTWLWEFNTLQNVHDNDVYYETSSSSSSNSLLIMKCFIFSMLSMLYFEYE